jgi:hypothetical protein
MAKRSLNCHFLLQLRADDWERLATAAKWQPESLAGLCLVKLQLLERFFKREFGQTPAA